MYCVARQSAFLSSPGGTGRSRRQLAAVRMAATTSLHWDPEYVAFVGVRAGPPVPPDRSVSGPCPDPIPRVENVRNVLGNLALVTAAGHGHRSSRATFANPLRLCIDICSCERLAGCVVGAGCVPVSSLPGSDSDRSPSIWRNRTQDRAATGEVAATTTAVTIVKAAVRTRARRAGRHPLPNRFRLGGPHQNVLRK